MPLPASSISYLCFLSQESLLPYPSFPGGFGVSLVFALEKISSLQCGHDSKGEGKKKYPEELSSGQHGAAAARRSDRNDQRSPWPDDSRMPQPRAPTSMPPAPLPCRGELQTGAASTSCLVPAPVFRGHGGCALSPQGPWRHRVALSHRIN